LEYEVILYDGTNLTANANENKDLFWALSGGGSGLITKIKTGVIQSPEPRPGQDRKFSYGSFQGLIDTDDKREEFWGAFQDFLYDSPEDDANAKFGANMGSIDNLFGMSFILLGGIGEAVDILNRYHLLKYPSSDTMPQVCFSNYQNCSAVDLPSQITRIYEFNTYGEAMLYKICQTTEVYLGMTNVSYPGDAYPDDGVCDALGLDQSKCPFQGLLPTPESCLDPDVIASLQRAVSDPLSFMNRPFYPDRGQNPNVPQNGADGPMEFTSRGGLLLPKLEASTWAKLSKGTNFTANHLQHGAPTKRTEDYITYPFRQHAILFDMTTANVPNLDFFMSTILEDPYYNNDKKKLSGYFNYMVSVNVEIIFDILYIAHFSSSHFSNTEPGWKSRLAQLLL
jgi:hypothetical protein